MKKIQTGLLFASVLSFNTFAAMTNHGIAASAKVVVRQSLTFTNQLKPAVGLETGETYNSHQLIAIGIIKSEGGQFNEVTLKWDRSTNPSVSDDPSVAYLSADDSHLTEWIRLGLMKEGPHVGDVSDVSNDLMHYTFAATDEVSYEVRVSHETKFSAGEHYISIIADVSPV